MTVSPNIVIMTKDELEAVKREAFQRGVRRGEFEKWLKPKPTLVAETWLVTISGFDGSKPPATASFIWPDETPPKIPNEMVLMTKESFHELCRRAGHGVGETIR